MRIKRTIYCTLTLPTIFNKCLAGVLIYKALINDVNCKEKSSRTSKETDITHILEFDEP